MYLLVNNQKETYFQNCLKILCSIKHRLLLTILLIVSMSSLFAQGQGNFWYFGGYAGLNFNSGSPVAVTNGVLNTTEGCASISTSSGNLLFYTDGVKVYNRQHLQMPNGFGLMGDASSTQSAIIVPKPGSTSIYYIFTTPATGGGFGLRYSEVDMTLAAGLGNVTANKNIYLYSPVCEKLTSVKQSNGTDYWVIAHDLNTADFLVYSVTGLGVNTTPVISNAGSVDPSGDGMGHLKASMDATRLVQNIEIESAVDVLNFDNATGSVTFDFTFTTAYLYPYGCEFSPDGSRLYISGNFTTLYQYNMTLGSSAAIIASEQIIGTTVFGGYLGAIQNGPDGKIYVANDGDYYLGCINNPNALGIACNFNDTAIYLGGQVSYLGLPNFIQTIFNVPSMYYVNNCQGDTTVFYLSDTSAIDSVHWQFGDIASGVNNTSSLFTPGHVFTNSGVFSVTCITFTASVQDTLMLNTIINGPPVISLGNDTSICSGTSLTLVPGSVSYTGYLWQDNSVNASFTANAGGLYYVTVVGQCGIATDSIFISLLPSPVVSVTDDAICVGTPSTLVATGAVFYGWPNGVMPTGQNTASVSPTVTTSYTVTGTSGACSSTDVATVSVFPVPAPQITSNITSGCAPLCVQFNEQGNNNCDSVIYSFGDGGTDNSSSPLHCYAVQGIYTVLISCKNPGCWGTTTYNGMITVDSTPVAHFAISPSSIVSPNTAVTFVNTTYGGSFYSWNFDDPSSGLSNTSLLNSPGHTYATEGNYCVKLIVVNTGGCSDSISECLDVVNDIVVPNVFTPNGDGRNDLFEIKDLQLGIASLKIYDRWGIKIYESSAYNNDWSGGSATDGVYYYIMDYPPLSKNYTGFIELLKY